MKPKQEFGKCEFCDKLISLQSPPSSESYNNAEIHLGQSSSILLPDRIVEKDNHAESLEGLYCSPKCLIAMIKKILGKESKKYLT